MSFFIKKSIYLLMILFGITLSAQVGIGTTNPHVDAELDVVGDIHFSGELKPNDDSGTAGQLLMSDGAGNPTVWGASLGNVTAITRYVTSGLDIDANTTYTITIGPITGLTTSANAIIDIQGNWGSDIYDDLTIHNIEIRTDEIRFCITNNTGSVVPGDMSAATFYDAAGGASLTTSFATINLDTTLLNNDTSTFALASDIVTISQTGFYSVGYSVTAQRNAGANNNRGSLDARVSFDDGGGFVPILGSSSEQYWRHNGGNGSTATKQFNYYFEAGDEVRLEAKESTNGIATVADSSSMSFTLLRGGTLTTGYNYPGMIFNIVIIE